MKILKINFLFILIASLIFVTSCKDDNVEDVSIFIGNYLISSAVISDTVTVSTNQFGNFTIPVETDITSVIQAALLSQVTCTSADKSWVELRSDNKIIMSCEGSNELDAGTWEEVSETELKLNLNNNAIPSSPTGMVLNVTDINIVGTTMSGKTIVPLPKEMISALIAPLTLSANNPPVITLKFSIQFDKL